MCRHHYKIVVEIHWVVDWAKAECMKCGSILYEKETQSGGIFLHNSEFIERLIEKTGFRIIKL